MDERQPACVVGQKIKLNGKTWTVAHLYAKEARLERNKGREVLIRNQRTLARVIGAAS